MTVWNPYDPGKLRLRQPRSGADHVPRPRAHPLDVTGEIHRLGEERGRATRRDVASCRISSAASAYRPWREQQRCQGEAPSVVVVVRPSGIMASLSPIILQSISNNEFKILMHGRPLCHSRQYIWNLISNRCQSLLQFKFPIPICNSRV